MDYLNCGNTILHVAQYGLTLDVDTFIARLNTMSFNFKTKPFLDNLPARLCAACGSAHLPAIFPVCLE